MFPHCICKFVIFFCQEQNVALAQFETLLYKASFRLVAECCRSAVGCINVEIGNFQFPISLQKCN